MCSIESSSACKQGVGIFSLYFTSATPIRRGAALMNTRPEIPFLPKVKVLTSITAAQIVFKMKEKVKTKTLFELNELGKCFFS